jgi:hypothetical protein
MGRATRSAPPRVLNRKGRGVFYPFPYRKLHLEETRGSERQAVYTHVQQHVDGCLVRNPLDGARGFKRTLGSGARMSHMKWGIRQR